MNEALKLEVGQRVLEVGAGSGWHACTIAEVVASSDTPRSEWGHVYTIEILQQLASFARRNVMRAGYGDRVTTITGDGSLGFPDRAPYDRILVTAAAPEIPEPLIEQLKVDGILLIPVGGTSFFQSLIRITKLRDGSLKRENLGGVAFVPLTGKYGFKI